jgi:uncharacterized membrane protein YhaH (DUF805 family)
MDQCHASALIHFVVRRGPGMNLLFSFYGRIGRGKYFLGLVLNIVWVMVAYTIVLFALGAQQQLAGQSPEQMNPMVLLAFAPISLVSGWISFALAAKRFHDMGVTGWLTLLLFVPLANFVVVLVLLFKGGEQHDNQYGPVPA